LLFSIVVLQDERHIITPSNIKGIAKAIQVFLSFCLFPILILFFWCNYFQVYAFPYYFDRSLLVLLNSLYRSEITKFRFDIGQLVYRLRILLPKLPIAMYLSLLL